MLGVDADMCCTLDKVDPSCVTGFFLLCVQFQYSSCPVFLVAGRCACTPSHRHSGRHACRRAQTVAGAHSCVLPCRQQRMVSASSGHDSCAVWSGRIFQPHIASAPHVFTSIGDNLVRILRIWIPGHHQIWKHTGMVNVWSYTSARHT